MAGLVSDGLIAQSEQQAAEFWTVREQLPQANRLIGSVSSHDISIPLRALPEFIEDGVHGLLSDDAPQALAAAMTRVSRSAVPMARAPGTSPR